MDDNDRQAIEGLFAKLEEVGRRAPPRDPEAEAFIAGAMARLPGAGYHMAQTVVAQEAALTAAQARIEALETQGDRRGGGGFFGSLFGDDAGQPRAGRGRPAQPVPTGGGFLAGAAQTALGVTGGLLLADALGGMFGEAEAATAAPEDAAGLDEPGLDDAGGDLDMDF